MKHIRYSVERLAALAHRLEYVVLASKDTRTYMDITPYKPLRKRYRKYDSLDHSSYATTGSDSLNILIFRLLGTT